MGKELQNLENVNGYKPMSNVHNLLIELSGCGSAARLGGKSPKWQDIKFDNKGETYTTPLLEGNYISLGH